MMTKYLSIYSPAYPQELIANEINWKLNGIQPIKHDNRLRPLGQYKITLFDCLWQSFVMLILYFFPLSIEAEIKSKIDNILW